jgi:hypothetical protein
MADRTMCYAIDKLAAMPSERLPNQHEITSAGSSLISSSLAKSAAGAPPRSPLSIWNAFQEIAERAGHPSHVRFEHKRISRFNRAFTNVQSSHSLLLLRDKNAPQHVLLISGNNCFERQNARKNQSDRGTQAALSTGLEDRKSRSRVKFTAKKKRSANNRADRGEAIFGPAR